MKKGKNKNAKSFYMHFRVSKQERKTIEKNAAKHQETLSDYIRRKAVNDSD